MIPYLWLLALLEELLLSLLLVTLLPCKVLFSRNLLNLCRINTGDIDLGRSGDNITSVNSSEGYTVDLEWTSDKEDTLVEVLQENNTLATESASEEDEDGTGNEAGARSRDADRLANLNAQLVQCHKMMLLCSKPR
jgi:hypothetical protein